MDLDPGVLAAELEKVIPELMEKAKIPGLSLAVIREGNILWTRGFGIKSLKTGDPVDENTIFEAASLTKPFFAFAVMKLVEAGDLELDSPLIDYLPRDIIENKLLGHPLDLEGFRAGWFRRITARLALSHSAGMPHGERGKPYPLLFEPGEKYKYSSQGYYYLQLVVEHLHGKPLEELMNDLVIEPLKMTNSSMVWRDEYANSAAAGHDQFGETTGTFRKRREAHAAASLYTTAADYARFVTAVMNDRGVRQETADEMLSPQIQVNSEIDWGLGFGLEHTENGTAFWQWGDYGIFRNYITAFKAQKIGVVYLTNSFNGLSIGQDILDHAIGGRDPALVMLDYPRFDSPSSSFIRELSDKGMKAAEIMFHALREKYPDRFTEAHINSTGYTFLNSERFDEALFIFRLNVEAFPKSANACDSLAEAYMKSGNREKALEYYEKTLEKIPDDPRPDKDFLERLKQGAVDNLEKLKK